MRKGEITFDTALQGLTADKPYALRATITDKGSKVTEFTSKAFQAGDLKEGRIAVTEKWKPAKLWDTITPQNTYDVSISLLEGSKVLDTALPVRFGFREFWIEGRDFYLNGTRIFLSALPLDNAQVGASQATYEAAKESMLRLQSTGINFVYTHNYGCEPGTHLTFAEILRAADDVGMLVSLSQPHFGQYDWKSPAEADQKGAYAHHAEFYVRVAQNHPSVVFYSMSHNATGYGDDMNPDMIDGIVDPRTEQGTIRAGYALRAEAIVRHFDPSRIVYHHHSGNLGAMYTINFYPNFVPIQEMSEWFGHWATVGVKPVFTCEYAAPFTWDWSLYRGYYKGRRELGSAPVPWEFCNAEWNAQFVGDKAYQILDAEKEDLRWEAKKFQAGEVWHRWDYPNRIGSDKFVDEFPVSAMYLTDNWRGFRTLGMSANSPWEHGHYWTLRPASIRAGRNSRWIGRTSSGRASAPTTSASAICGWTWISSAPTGFPPPRRSRSTATTCRCWPTSAAKRPPSPARTTTSCPAKRWKSNSSSSTTPARRFPASANGRWRFRRPQPAARRSLNCPPASRSGIPLSFALPAGLAPGKYELVATVKFSNGETQSDTFAVHVLPSSPAQKVAAKIALFDPKGETAKLLEGLGVKCQPVQADADLSGYDVLIVGKAALTPDGPGPNVTNVRSGLKVVVFEQDSKVLEKRFGFRVVEYGLRNVFLRLADHPVLAGLDLDNLRDWRGEATLLPPQLKYETSRPYGPYTIRWCDIPMTHVWRCGNRGNVASVLIEKPARGNFLPIVDGGFSLQYSPLMEYREGRGMVLFCQMDVTGRTESDPAAERLARNILAYAAGWKPAASRQALYVGDPAGKSHLEKIGVAVGSYEGGKPSAEQVLIVGPGAGDKLTANAAAIGEWLKAGGRLLAIGLDQPDVAALLPNVTMKKAEHIAAYFVAADTTSPLAGIGPADVHNREPKDFPLISAGAAVVGDGVLAMAEGGNVVLCQLVPWQCDYSKEKHNVKQTFRRFTFLVTRLLGNIGVEGSTPVLARFSSPVDAAKAEKRWLDGLYLDQPEEWDNPYRFFRW